MGVNTAQVGNHWREGIVQRAPSVNNQVFVGLFQFSSFCLQWVAILADDDKFSTIPDENQSDERRKSISDRVIDFVAVWHPFPEKWRIASHLTGYSVFVMARPEPEYGLFSRSNRANAIIGLSIDRLSKNLFDGRQNSRYTRRSSDLFWPPNLFKMAGRQSLSDNFGTSPRAAEMAYCSAKNYCRFLGGGECYLLFFSTMSLVMITFTPCWIKSGLKTVGCDDSPVKSGGYGRLNTSKAKMHYFENARHSK